MFLSSLLPNRKYLKFIWISLHFVNFKPKGTCLISGCCYCYFIRISFTSGLPLFQCFRSTFHFLFHYAFWWLTILILFCQLCRFQCITDEEENVFQVLKYPASSSWGCKWIWCIKYVQNRQKYRGAMPIGSRSMRPQYPSVPSRSSPSRTGPVSVWPQIT